MREIADLASRFGPRVAVDAPGEAVRYADLAARVAAARVRFAERGVAAHDRVALHCQATTATIAAALALLEQRCVVLPVAADAPAAALQAPLATFRPAWEVREEQVSAVEVAAPAASAAAPLSDGEAVAAPLQALLSSGSAGVPKIVLRSAAQVVAGVRIFAGGVDLSGDDRVLLLVPLQHSFGFNSVMLAALSHGATIVIPRSRHPRGITAEVVERGVTLLPAPPLFFEWMCGFADEVSPPRWQLRAVVSVGDIVPRSTYESFRRRFGAALWQSYGASEAGPLLLNRTGVCGDETMALGQPYPEVEIALRDESGVAVADGTVGEIVARSPAVALGYLGVQDDGCVIAGREFRSGDLAVRRDGEIHFGGRRKVLITRAGRKIDPAEIERVLRTHPGVLDAAVRVAGLTGHDPLQALVVTRHAVAADELIDHCARSLEGHKVPRRIEFRGALPRDAAGKLQRERLRTW